MASRGRVWELSDSEEEEEEKEEDAPITLAPPPVEESVEARSEKESTNERVSMELRYPEFGAPVDDAHDGEFGEWRTVPGFSSEKLVVSSMGWYRTFCGGRWFHPSRGNLNPSSYRSMSINKNGYPVHALVCRAFNGPCTKGQTCDHIDCKGPKDDNRAINLRWATRSEQNMNQKMSNPHNIGKPILVRHKDWPTNTPWMYYLSSLAAEKALGVTHLRHGACKRAKDGTVRRMSGFEAKWAPPCESQDNLPPETEEAPPPREQRENGVNYLDDQPERWAASHRFPDRLWVSTRGRIQSKLPNGDDWGYKRTAKAGTCVVYPQAHGKGVHILVFETFVHPVVYPETIDHVNRDTEDCRLVNLRAASKSEQRLNRTRKPTSEIHDSMKTPVEARPYFSADPWEWFESACEAARTLNTRLPVKGFHAGNLMKVVRGKISQHRGYEFRAAPRKRKREGAEK